MQVVILDREGAPLVRVELEHGENENFLVSPVDGSGPALFTYYFMRAGRVVTIDLGEVRITGALRTRWRDNHRIWWVEAAQPAGGQATTPAPAVIAAPPEPAALA